MDKSLKTWKGQKADTKKKWFNKSFPQQGMRNERCMRTKKPPPPKHTQSLYWGTTNATKSCFFTKRCSKNHHIRVARTWLLYGLRQYWHPRNSNEFQQTGTVNAHFYKLQYNNVLTLTGVYICGQSKSTFLEQTALWHISVHKDPLLWKATWTLRVRLSFY